jgi:hypothetical protein
MLIRICVWFNKILGQILLEESHIVVRTHTIPTGTCGYSGYSGRRRRPFWRRESCWSRRWTEKRGRRVRGALSGRFPTQFAVVQEGRASWRDTSYTNSPNTAPLPMLGRSGTLRRPCTSTRGCLLHSETGAHTWRTPSPWTPLIVSESPHTHHPISTRTVCKRPTTSKPRTMPRKAVFTIMNAWEGIRVVGIRTRPSTTNTYRNNPAQLDCIDNSQGWVPMWNGWLLPRSRSAWRTVVMCSTTLPSSRIILRPSNQP